MASMIHRDADGSFQIFPKKRSYIKKSGIISEYINIGYSYIFK